MPSEWKRKWQVKVCGLEPSMPAQQQRDILRQLIHEAGHQACQPCCIVVAINKDGGNDHAYLHYNHPHWGKEQASLTYRFFVDSRPTTFGNTITTKLIGPPPAQESPPSLSHYPLWARTRPPRAHQNTSAHIDEMHQMQRKMQTLESNVAELHKTMQEGARSNGRREVLHDIMGDYYQSTEEYKDESW